MIVSTGLVGRQALAASRILTQCPHDLLRQQSRQWQRQRRRLHQLPRLSNEAQFAQQNGLTGVIEGAAFKQAWHDYQGWLIAELNQRVAGTVDENTVTKALVLKYARNAEKAALFNYASMAHNNFFFFSTLSNQPRGPSQYFLDAINTSFSSIDSLRATMLASANAMFGPGFVWLVALTDHVNRSQKKLALLNTYAAGSPYPAAHWRRQPEDMATTDRGVKPGENPAAWAYRQGQFAGTYGLNRGGSGGGVADWDAGLLGSLGRPGGRQDSSKVLGPGAQELEPLLCLNTWEYAWLQQWGVGGKRLYLDRLWDKIDWSLVENNWTEATRDTRNRGRRP